MWAQVKFFINPFDGRYEDLIRGNRTLNVFRDFTAGLIVAMVAIPLAMGFAMASGLKPGQGIVGGAIAGLVGALFGGSKYQVYGPTAAFIPIIGGMMALYPDDPALGHGFLVLCSLIAGVMLAFMGLFQLGRFVKKVPHSIVVGFTLGIAVVIGMSQIGYALGLTEKLGYRFIHQVQGIWQHIGEVSFYAVVLSLGTFFITKHLLKISPFLPAPLIALGLGTLIATTVWAEKPLPTIEQLYGSIPTDFWVFTPPVAFATDSEFIGRLFYFVLAIIFVAAIESLLCSRMADRLADNKGIPYHPNKELWGQGWVNIICPLLNGFPHTGALARTATNIKVGAISPLAGIFKCILKLLLAAYLARYLDRVPMACIAGILLYVASAMVKPQEVLQILAHNRFHTVLMFFTAVMVVVTDFLMGVLSALIVYAALFKIFDRPTNGGDADETADTAADSQRWAPTTTVAVES
jgi:SulP family sulfate permease